MVGRSNTLDDLDGRYNILANGCWQYNGCCGTAGYGLMRYKGRMDLAHRLSWLRYKGPIPDGKCILHKCDNPACINPEHLWLGTHADNAIDREVKGRGWRPGPIYKNSQESNL